MIKNKIQKTSLLIVVIISILIMNFNKFMPRINNVFAISSTAEIVMELKTNRVVHAVNEKVKKYMASTTKILTAITIIENCNLNDKVKVGKNTVGIEGSSIYLQEGEILTVEELLYGLMLRSGNDCAETLAVYCSGSIDNFALLMNKMAKRIGANDSKFVNPHGLHNDNHYTTAYDLALISCYAMKNDVFRKIVGTKSIKIPFTTQHTNRLLINKNKMLNQFDAATGIKTGYTKKAGRCLVSSALKNGIEFICVVLNCPQMFEISQRLLTSAFNEYKNYNILNSDEILAFVDVDNNSEKCAVCTKNDIILPLKEIEKENLIIKYEIVNKLFLPIKKDQEVGFVKIYYQNNLLFEQKIYTIIEMK